MAAEFRLPDIGEGLAEVEIVRWLVAVGDRVSVDQPIVEVETDKALMELPSPYGGVVIFRGAEAGATLAVGEVLVVIGEEGEAWAPDASSAEEAPPIVGTLATDVVTIPAGGGVQALPAVRKLAAELGVDLATVAPTGPGGRVTEDDVRGAAGGRGPEERVRMSPLRRAVAENLARSWREIPHVTTFGSADAGALLEMRKRFTAEGPFPLEALLVHLVVPALVAFPEFNASVAGDDIVYKRHYDIGVAVDTPDGLIVPVVKDAGERSPADLAAEITRLAQAARSRSLQTDELRGATFTVSNIGAAGGGYGTPIVPYGTTAILSVGRAAPQVVAREGRPEIVTTAPLSLSYDHRAIDGALGRRFLAEVIARLERPE